MYEVTHHCTQLTSHLNATTVRRTHTGNPSTSTQGYMSLYEPGELKYEPTHGNAEVGNGLHKTWEGEDYRVQEPNNGITHPAPSPTANTAAKPVPREHMWFDWVTETDKLISPVPNTSNFHPTNRV
jgi:hypothetical protein